MENEKIFVPENRQIDKNKIVEYLLHAVNSRGKAEFFFRYGFQLSKWQNLQDALFDHALCNPVTSVVVSAHGTKYSVVGPMSTPGKREPRPLVCAVWQQDIGKDFVRLITAYPSKEQ